MTFTSVTRRVPARAALGTALAATVLGCTAIAETGSTRAPAPDTDTIPVACAVNVDTSGGTLLIEGVVEARADISGSYRLRVERAGSLMNQGGYFALNAGETTTLGRVMLAGQTSGLEAELLIDIDGDQFTCPVDL